MGFFTNSASKVDWKQLNSDEQIDAIIADKSGEYNLVFKHSTRCGISSMAKNQFEREYSEQEGLNIWYLDLLQYRPISNRIAEEAKVVHQSPQAIVFRNGEVVYSASHSEISATDVINLITK